MRKNVSPFFFALLGTCVVCSQPTGVTAAEEVSPPGIRTLEEAKAAGALRSSYRKEVKRTDTPKAPQADLKGYKEEIEPLLREACVQCHGPEKQKGDFRVDTLDPDLIHGGDANWWLEIIDVVTNAEMPPEDEDVELSDESRGKIIDWLSNEIQVASQVVRSEQGHSSFRRMTRYEYNYALQDLLGLPFDFASDLPPETASEDGFQNSSEMLQMSAMQFETYRKVARQALTKATVNGERPEPLYFGISMGAVLAQKVKGYDEELAKIRSRHESDPDKLKKELERHSARHAAKSGNTRYTNLDSGKSFKASWSYMGAKGAMPPTGEQPDVPPVSEDVVIIPAKQSFTVDLQDSLPDAGIMRVRIRASGTAKSAEDVPILRVFFGHQASNNSKAESRIGDLDVAITASPDAPQFYQWDIPLSEVIRNPYRGVTTLGTRPNPGEFVKFQNTSMTQAEIRIDYLEVTAPAYDEWPPKSHTNIFIESEHQSDETRYAREVLAHFMPKAWRRPVTEAEIDQKLALFANYRPGCNDFLEAMIEVLAGVISSPKFLYLVQSGPAEDESKVATVTDMELATRLSMFLWSSVPDEELVDLASKGELKSPDILINQTERMLADPKAQRFSKHFVRQWLGMQLLDFLKVDKKTYGQFDDDLREAMQDEPVAFFRDALEENHSVMDFLHADYTMVNERLARHYGLREVYGNHFRKVALKPEDQRGGLLTQAGLLAMNSDGKDSHPLKRGIWLLENLLHDPPPPPPPAVPEIDLTDPDILKLTLKERMEDHRSDPACFSCHAKIDPWGIAFENFDAVGIWRTEIAGKPVDANSVLFNRQDLHGMEGLKRFLLENRQDQFARAMVYKLTSYALGRPLSFADRSSIEQITRDLRQQGDGLATLITLIVRSELFQSK